MDTWEALYGTLTSDQVKVLLTKGFRNRLAQCPFKKTTFMVHLQAPFMFVGASSFKNGAHK